MSPIGSSLQRVPPSVSGVRTQRTIVLDSPRSLDKFRRTLRSPLLPPARIVVDPRFVDDSDALERRLNALYSDCGCKAGSAATLLTALALVAQLVASGKPPRSREGLQGIAVLGGAAIAGKAAGLVRSRVALLQTTAGVRAR